MLEVDKKIRVGIIGSTGSIGTQTLRVIQNHKDRFEVSLLSCKRNLTLLAEQIENFNPTTVIHGDTTALNYSETYKDCDIVINGISGLAGLYPTIAILESPAKLATANKESIVAFGSVITKIAKKFKKEIFPLDSEHSAIWQCIEDTNNVDKLILTASGGPFRSYSKEQINAVKADDALKHPTWKMGLKITIDSATLMNKGMELIEAKHLFGLENIDVVIHRESIIHSLVKFKDGSMKASLSYPDMTLPIQYALTEPKRLKTTIKDLDLGSLGLLTFGKPDYVRFPCLNIAKDLLSKGDYEGTVLTAADDVAVDLFLNNKISFYGISDLIYKCLNEFKEGSISEMGDVLRLDADVRKFITSLRQ